MELACLRDQRSGLCSGWASQVGGKNMRSMKGEEEFNKMVNELATLTPAVKVPSAGSKGYPFPMTKARGTERQAVGAEYS